MQAGDPTRRAECYNAAMVSVIIPVLNEAALIGPALAALLEQPGAFEVIVADGGSQDGTAERVRQLPVLLVEQPAGEPPGLGTQINRGAQRAAGDILLFLHIDVTLPAGGFNLIEAACADSDVIGGGFVPAYDGPVPTKALWRLALVERIWQWATVSLRWFAGDTAPFIRATVFRQSGGYPPAGFASDWDFARRLQRLGRLAAIREPARVHSRRLVQNGIFTTMLVTLSVSILYQLRADRVFLRQWYQRWLPRER